MSSTTLLFREIDRATAWAMLSSHERQKAEAYRYANDREACVARWCFARTVLARRTGLSPGELVFARDSLGKPRLVSPGLRGLDFSLSRTKDLFVCLVGPGPLGVDVEWLGRKADPIAVARRFFTADEAGEVLELSRDAGRRRFFEYWTLKEAYTKALGCGLRMPLNSYGFRFERAEGGQLPRLKGERTGSWTFQVLTLAQVYVVALALPSGCGSGLVPIYWSSVS